MTDLKSSQPTIFAMIADFFDGDEKKAVSWFLAPNPMLGNVTPVDMLCSGRGSKLRRFVIENLAENNLSPDY